MNERKYCYLNKDKSVPCPVGDRYKDKNILIKDGDNLSLKKVGRIDTVEQINSYEDGVSLQKMIERFQRGDTSALTRGVGFYADVSGYEKDPRAVIENGRKLVSEIGNNSNAAQADQPQAYSEKTENVSENGKESVNVEESK